MEVAFWQSLFLLNGREREQMNNFSNRDQGEV